MSLGSLLERCLTKWLEDADPTECVDLVEAIRAHLAQPQGEPVAWINPAGTYAEASTSSTVYGSHTIPLYIHPAHTEAEVQEIFNAAQQAFNPTNYGYHQRDFGDVVRRILGVKP